MIPDLRAADGNQCEECGTELYQAGERVPAGSYLRVDDGSFQGVSLPVGGPLPASFDGHVALYRAAATPCICERRHAEAAACARTKTVARTESVPPSRVSSPIGGRHA